MQVKKKKTLLVTFTMHDAITFTEVKNLSNFYLIRVT